MSDDPLFDARNHFHLGHFQTAINEAMGANVGTDALRVERDVLMYRAYLEQGNFAVVMSEVQDSAPPALRAVKLLCQYKQSDDAGRQAAVGALQELLAGANVASDTPLSVTAAAIFCLEKDYKEALKCTHQGQTLEALAMVTHVYAAMNRADLAEKQVAIMQRHDDDATLTQLAAATAMIAKGSGKYQDAMYIYQDMSEKYGPSALLLNNLATCCMLLGKYEDAESHLQEALGKNPADPTTLANMVVCLQHLKKAPDVVTRYITQLRTAAPTHPWVEAYGATERTFDRCAAQLSR